MNVRKTGGRNELDIYRNVLRGLIYRKFVAPILAAMADGSTDGFLQTTATVGLVINGLLAGGAPVGATDDFFDLSGETDTLAGKFRAYWLYVDSGSAASIVASSSDGDTAQEALERLPDHDPTKCIFGVYVAGPLTDFDGAAGLAAQGTIHEQIPDFAAKARIDTDITMVAA